MLLDPALFVRILWLALPTTLGGVLHMIVVKRGLWSSLAIPLDGGRAFRGQPLLGPNKTWRGVLVMVGAAGVLGATQGACFGAWAAARTYAPVDFAAVGDLLGAGDSGAMAVGYGIVHAVLGLGYVLGELPNSFLKRRLGVEAGGRARGLLGVLCVVLDQSDSVTCALGLGLAAFSYPWEIFGWGVLLLSLLHLGITWLLQRSRLKHAL